MKFLKSILNRRIKMLGRAGIIYKVDNVKYFVDSEALVGNPAVVIFHKNIYVDNNRSIVLSEQDKASIANKLKEELESMGMQTIIQ